MHDDGGCAWWWWWWRRWWLPCPRDSRPRDSRLLKDTAQFENLIPRHRDCIRRELRARLQLHRLNHKSSPIRLLTSSKRKCNDQKIKRPNLSQTPCTTARCMHHDPIRLKAIKSNLISLKNAQIGGDKHLSTGIINRKNTGVENNLINERLRNVFGDRIKTAANIKVLSTTFIPFSSGPRNHST